jgi:uncharacterized protein YggU (UPF0235/DUF167 family)
MKFKNRDKVVTGDGHEGKVVGVDSNRKLIAVQITEPGTVGRNKGDEVVYRESELRKK